jgi:hypothetical protein
VSGDYAIDIIIVVIIGCVLTLAALFFLIWLESK